MTEQELATKWQDTRERVAREKQAEAQRRGAERRIRIRRLFASGRLQARKQRVHAHWCAGQVVGDGPDAECFCGKVGR